MRVGFFFYPRDIQYRGRESHTLIQMVSNTVRCTNFFIFLSFSSIIPGLLTLPTCLLSHALQMVLASPGIMCNCQTKKKKRKGAKGLGRVCIFMQDGKLWRDHSP